MQCNVCAVQWDLHVMMQAAGQPRCSVSPSQHKSTFKQFRYMSLKTCSCRRGGKMETYVQQPFHLHRVISTFSPRSVSFVKTSKHIHKHFLGIQTLNFSIIIIIIIFPHRVTSGSGPRHHRHFTIAIRNTTLSRIPLDQWSARRRDRYLTKHNTHNRQTFTSLAEFELAITGSERPQTHALDRADTGIGIIIIIIIIKL